MSPLLDCRTACCFISRLDRILPGGLVVAGLESLILQTENGNILTENVTKDVSIPENLEDFVGKMLTSIKESQ